MSKDGDIVPTESKPLAPPLPSGAIGGRNTVETSVSRFLGEEAHTASDVLAVEEPLEVQLGYGTADARHIKSISVTMRTPGHDFELAAGFLMTEGVVRDSADIGEIFYVSGRSSVAEPLPRDINESDDLILPYQPERNIVRFELSPDVPVSLANLERNFYTTSSCGICGKASLLALRTVCPPRTANTLKVEAISFIHSLTGFEHARMYLKGRTDYTHWGCLILTDTFTPSERISGVIMRWTSSWVRSSLTTAHRYGTAYFCCLAGPASSYCRRRL
jgi:FdhD protein